MTLIHFHLTIKFSKRFSFVIKIKLNVIGIQIQFTLPISFNDYD